jgi:hypothetical protein
MVVMVPQTQAVAVADQETDTLVDPEDQELLL